MSPSTIEHLRHILDETDYLMRSAIGLTLEDFKGNDTLKRAFVRRNKKRVSHPTTWGFIMATSAIRRLP